MDDVTDSPAPSQPRDEMELAYEWGEGHGRRAGCGAGEAH
jgi:hypothetical protein